MADASTSLDFPIGAADDLAEEIWSQKNHVEVQFENYFYKSDLIAEDVGGEDAHMRKPGKPIMLKSEFDRQAGQTMHMRLRKQLKRGMRLDENGATDLTLYTRSTSYAVGNEEPLDYYDMQVKLEKLKHFVGYNSPDINQHRTSIDLEDDTESALQEWMAEQEEELIRDGFIEGSAYIAQQSGLTSPVEHPHSYYVSGAGDLDGMGDTHKMSAVELKRIMRFCKVRKLNPIKVDGENCFVVLMSSALITDLLNDTEFQTVVAQAHTRGHENPLVSGAIGKFYNLFIHCDERARAETTKPNVEQVLILGANALALGYGSEPRFLVRNEDGYGDRYGRGIARIIGCARADWVNSADSDTLNQSSGIWHVWKDEDEFDIAA